MALYLGKDLVSASSGLGVTIKNQDKNITANGTYRADSGYTGLGTVTVDVGSAVSVSPKDVNFYDYDGTILHSYTVEEAQELTELPELPTQEGLICQGWNYDLETIKSYNRAVDVGAMYITDDGKTRFYIRITDVGRKTIRLFYGQSRPNGVLINWGDGSPAEYGNSYPESDITHTYDSMGDYTISFEVADDCEFSLGRGTSGMFGITNNSGKCSHNMLRKAEVGKGITTINGGFNGCASLESVTIPIGVTNINKSTFSGCYSLNHITIPKNVTSILDSLCSQSSIRSISIPNSVTHIGSNAFAQCYGLAHITIPNNVTSFGNGAFTYCSSLSSLIIPKSVTSITGSLTFQCYSIAFYDFTNHTVVPTLSASNNLLVYGDTIVLIPASLYDEWIAATNWSTHADYIVAV